MEDELFLYQEELREKKSIAHSAKKRRGKCGKRGACKLPSDYKTRKELGEMNGDVVVYNLKKPMNWGYFKLMPDDLKREYLEGIMERYGVSVREISEMLGIHFTVLYKVFKALSVETGKRNMVKDADGFREWVSGGSFKGANDVAPAEEPVEAPFEAVPEKKVLTRAVPKFGTMDFEGVTEDVLAAVRAILGGANVKLSVRWSVMED